MAIASASKSTIQFVAVMAKPMATAALRNAKWRVGNRVSADYEAVGCWLFAVGKLNKRPIAKSQ